MSIRFKSIKRSRLLHLRDMAIRLPGDRGDRIRKSLHPEGCIMDFPRPMRHGRP